MDSPHLTDPELLAALVAIALVVGCARASGEIARRLGSPEVVGELLAGVILGPSVLGALAPQLHHLLFTTVAGGYVLSALSWLGALLLLLVAGLEVDLGLLLATRRAGVLAAAGGMLPSAVVGAALGIVVLHVAPREAIFFGIVLSVTAVSVLARVLIEREVLRRRYAQVTLAAGIGGEVVVWLAVAAIAASSAASPALAIAKRALLASALLAIFVFFGPRLTSWAMRRVADTTTIAQGPLSLVLVMMLLAAALSHAVGLHPLLGAFSIGVLLRRAPRSHSRPLLDGIQSLTAALFGPIFFVLAGMRVNVFELRTPSAWASVALIIAVATLTKIGFGALGARAGGIRGWETIVVGAGLNVKGGTDVIVAIVGVELGLLAPRVYTVYAVVAIATVIFSPALLSWTERRAPIVDEEKQRLVQEKAAEHAYVRGIERVLVPVDPKLRPALATDILHAIAAVKQAHDEHFDISELIVDDTRGLSAEPVASAIEHLDRVGDLEKVELTRKRLGVRGALREIVETSAAHDLVAIGGAAIPQRGGVSFGRLVDAMIRGARSDTLLVVGKEDGLELAPNGRRARILVPINGLEGSVPAAELAAYIAKGVEGELVLMNVVYTQSPLLWREVEDDPMLRAAEGMLAGAARRIDRLEVQLETRVRVGRSAGGEIVKELQEREYDLVVLSASERGVGRRLSLGGAIETVLARARTPAALLVRRDPARIR